MRRAALGEEGCSVLPTLQNNTAEWVSSSKVPLAASRPRLLASSRGHSGTGHEA